MRSGIVAFGNCVIGQPSHSDASLISIGAETWGFGFLSALSLAQIETQATNIQTILIGSRAAINLIRGELVLDIAKIIPIQFGLRHPSSKASVDRIGG